MSWKSRDWLRLSMAIAVASALGACAKAPPPPPPPPAPTPPPVVEAVPYRPLPPQGASYTMDLPPIGADGQRTTVNTALDSDSTLWHFRSAWNVAALNCLEPQYGSILEGYSAFLKQNAKALSAAYNAIEGQFRQRHGSRNAGVKAREAYTTSVYNYFALPPARERFCDVVLAISNQYLGLSPVPDAKGYAATNLPTIEGVFQDFYRDYAAYQTASAEWDAKYGARYGASQPGYVAVHGVDGPSVGASLISEEASAPSENTPVVQPIPNE